MFPAAKAAALYFHYNTIRPVLHGFFRPLPGSSSPSRPCRLFHRRFRPASRCPDAASPPRPSHFAASIATTPISPSPPPRARIILSHPGKIKGVSPPCARFFRRTDRRHTDLTISSPASGSFFRPRQDQRRVAPLRPVFPPHRSPLPDLTPPRPVLPPAQKKIERSFIFLLTVTRTCDMIISTRKEVTRWPVS